MFTKHDSCDFHKSTDAALASKVDIATLLTAVHKTIGCILSNIQHAAKAFKATCLKQSFYKHSCQTLDVEIRCGLVERLDLVWHEHPLF